MTQEFVVKAFEEAKTSVLPTTKTKTLRFFGESEELRSKIFPRDYEGLMDDYTDTLLACFLLEVDFVSTAEKEFKKHEAIDYIYKANRKARAETSEVVIEKNKGKYDYESLVLSVNLIYSIFFAYFCLKFLEILGLQTSDDELSRILAKKVLEDIG